MVEIIEAECGRYKEEDIKAGANAIKKGNLVVFPTETVYGLGGDATSDQACQKIFKAKGRPSDNPLIVHFNSIMEIKEYTMWNKVPFHDQLEKLWPGPLTVIAEKNDKICSSASAGLDTIGVRIPDCDLARELILRSGVPIAAPSANASGRPSATSIDHIRKELGDMAEIMYKGQVPHYGIESTVIQPVGETCLILRPGAYTEVDLLKIFKRVEYAKIGEKVVSPGTKYRHYSPEKPLFRAEKFQIKDIISGRHDMIPILTDQSGADMNCKYISLGNANDPYDVSRHLYDALRRLDSSNASWGIIEMFPRTGYFGSIMNRIDKASIQFDADLL